MRASSPSAAGQGPVRDQPGQSVRRQPQGDQRLESLRIRLRPERRGSRRAHCGPSRRAAAGADHLDLQPLRRHLRLADLRQRGGARSRTSKSMAAIAGSAIIRLPSMPSPTGWRSLRASGRSSTAPAGRASCFRTGDGADARPSCDARLSSRVRCHPERSEGPLIGIAKGPSYARDDNIFAARGRASTNEI